MKTAGRRSQAERFQQGLEALVWLNNTRARRDKLNAEQTQQLEALGVAW